MWDMANRTRVEGGGYSQHDIIAWYDQRNLILRSSEFPHVKNLMNHSPWVPRYYKLTSEQAHTAPYQDQESRCSEGGESAIRHYIINTSYQKLPFGSRDHRDKLLFHQALN